MEPAQQKPGNEFLPSIAIVLGGVMWGLYWLPLRAVGESGLSGAWPGVLVYSGLCVMLLPFLIAQNRKSPDTNWRALAWSGLFTGTAFAFYTISLFLTDVIHSILLFYMTPVWSTALGLLFLGERLSLQRAVALILGLAGLFVILGLGVQIPWPRNLGDWLALISGMAWSYGTFCLYRMGQTGVVQQVYIFVLGSLLVSLAAVVFGGDKLGGAVTMQAIQTALPVALMVSLFVLPMIFLTLWPAALLSPGRVGLLLMGEVVVGIGSAAWLSGEPFGMREFIGASLIASAGLVEVIRRPG